MSMQFITDHMHMHTANKPRFQQRRNPPPQNCARPRTINESPTSSMLMPISPRSAYSLVRPILGHLGNPTFQSSRSVTLGQLLSVGVPRTLDGWTQHKRKKPR